MSAERNIKLYLTVAAGASLWALVVIVGVALFSGPASYLRLFLLQGIAPRFAGEIAGSPSRWWLPTIVATGLLVAGIIVAVQINHGWQAANPRLLVLCPLVLLASLAWAATHQRVLALPLLGWLSSLLVSYAYRTVAMRWLVIAGSLYLAASLSPVDFTLLNYPGQPHMVEVVDGLLSDSGVNAAESGELFPGGCGGAPIARWLWVW